MAVAGILAGLAALLPAAGPALAAGPGTLISATPLPPPRAGGNAYRIIYQSTGLQGQPIQVSGMVIVPRGTAPAGGRPIVAWAHPTTGIAESCAPSLANNVRYVQLQGLDDMLQRGYIIAAPDYPGLGSPGPHPYLIGVSEARSVLDAIRAAQQLTHNPPGPVAVWGHSQGGQAVLYSGLIASSYAPELKLVGVAAAAPATLLGKLMQDAEPTPGGKNILAMTLWSWNEVFGAPIDKVVLPAAMPTVQKLASTCIENINDIPGRFFAGRSLQQRFLSVDDLTAIEPWKSILAQNTIGTLPSPSRSSSHRARRTIRSTRR